MTTVPNECPNCHELTDHKFQAVIGDEAKSAQEIQQMRDAANQQRGRGMSVRHLTAEDKSSAAALATCSRCHAASLIRFSASYRTIEMLRTSTEPDGWPIGVGNFTVTHFHPTPEKASVEPEWPEKILGHFKDAQNMLRQEMTPSTIIGVCRTVLEISTTELGESDGKLVSRVTKLRDEGVITKPIADWAHTLRIEANAAIHEGEGTHEQAKEFVDFLRMFLNMTFSLPKKIDARRANNTE